MNAAHQHQDDQTHIDMFESGWFGRSAAFWRWVVTDDAKPYVEAMAAVRAPVDEHDETAGWAIDVDEHEDVLDPTHLAELRTRIETEYGS
jgi:hypothetical protein